MGTNQGKTILVLIDVVDRHLPSICVVAEFTLCAVLAAVKISVAILTFLRNVAEIEVGVAIETWPQQCGARAAETGFENA